MDALKTVAKLAGVDSKSRIVKMVLSTSVEDRVSDTIDQNGWRLDNYRKNPVVLWGHDRYTPPVGKCVEIGIGPSGLEGAIQFATAEEFALADTVYRLMLGGYLNAGSVSFKPIKYVWNEDTGGVDFSEQELLEFSIVTVPCNPQALVAAKADGVNFAPLLKAPATSPELLAALEAATKAAQPAASTLGRQIARAKAARARVRLI